MWTRYWRLSVDPFLASSPPYVSTMGHDEAVARLVETIESARRRAVVRAAEGLGKSIVMARALAATRHPLRRFTLVKAPVDGQEMFAALASGLGVPVSGDASRSSAWRALVDAVRLCHLQGFHAVLVVEDAHFLVEDADCRDLERLSHLESSPGGRLTVVQSFLLQETRHLPFHAFAARSTGELTIRLPALTRSETERYIAEKLSRAGRADPAFTPRALARLHEFSSGVPRGINRLGSLSLMAGAVRRRELVTPDIVEGVASECLSDSSFPAA